MHKIEYFGTRYVSFQSMLLARAVSILLDVISLPTPDDPDQKLDLPQVHAMNILKAVFKESSVSQALMPYIPEATIQAISGFASPYWAVRNAATQLFGTYLDYRKCYFATEKYINSCE